MTLAPLLAASPAVQMHALAALAGIFTFMPGRIMHAVLFGP